MMVRLKPAQRQASRDRRSDPPLGGRPGSSRMRSYGIYLAEAASASSCWSSSSASTSTFVITHLTPIDPVEQIDRGDDRLRQHQPRGDRA